MAAPLGNIEIFSCIQYTNVTGFLGGRVEEVLAPLKMGVF